MQTELRVNVFKLKSGELLIGNMTSEDNYAFEIEYPSVPQSINGRVMLLPFIPVFIDRYEQLMKRLVILKDTIMWESTADKQMINLYSDFMLKVQSSFSGIQLVGSLKNTPIDFKIK